MESVANSKVYISIYRIKYWQEYIDRYRKIDEFSSDINKDDI